MPASQLPERPSLEQLRKRAKDLLKAFRAGDDAAVRRVHVVLPHAVERRASDVTLADVQFIIAREHGFESWANLVHHIEAIGQSGLAQFERLARELADAYTTGNAMAIREINWNYGTSFVWDHDPSKMLQRLATWFASQDRMMDLALADTRRMVAHSYGFETWASFSETFARPRRPKTAAAHGVSSAPPFYTFDPNENTISVRGPMTPDDWDVVCDVMKEHRIARLSAGGMTDAGMERVAGLDHVTRLALGNSRLLTDEGLRHLARMPQLQELELGGPTSVVTDRGLDALRHLWELRFFSIAWNQNISDAGVANLASCDRLERVDLMGTHTGDGGIRALAGKSSLRLLHTGRCVTDAGLMLLHRIPAFSTRASSETGAADGIRADLLLDGPFTNAGLATLSGLEGLSALSFFWHCSRFTGEGLAPLTQLPNLVSFGCEGERCDDAAMRHIGEFPRLRKLNAQGTVASDVGFESLSRSRTIENIWGRECPNLTGRGFAALSAMTALRVLGISCKRVDDAGLATLPRFPVLTGFMPMDVPDDGFRHVGQCERLETLTCMYCSDTGDAATEHVANLPKLKSYYAGDTRITDRSLEILSHMQSLERLEFWSCSGITDRGVGQLAALPRLREIVLDGLPNVTQKITDAFPSHVRVKYLG